MTIYIYFLFNKNKKKINEDGIREASDQLTSNLLNKYIYFHI